jgi:hypothetical protein
MPAEAAIVFGLTPAKVFFASLNGRTERPARDWTLLRICDNDRAVKLEVLDAAS